jgi:O-antigen ligase/tetratricopeptide (TPR) repeat protein
MDPPPLIIAETTLLQPRKTLRKAGRRSGLKGTSFMDYWIPAAAAGAAIAACMVNGGSALALAIISLFTGAGLLIAPPRRALPRALSLCLLMAVAATTLAFLPSSLLGPLPEWRRHLIDDWGFNLPATLTSQPWLTLGGVFTLVMSGAWFCLLAGRGMGESSRRAALRTLTLGIYLIAALSLAQKLNWLNLGWPLDLPHSGLDLGPFANRNHFSGLCAIGCVLGAGMAHDAYRRKSPLTLLFGVGLLLPFAGIVINTSRAGLLLFFVGLTLWLTTASIRRGIFRKIALTFSLILSAAAVLLIFGGGSGARLVEQGLGFDQLGGRNLIYGETFRLISESPWVGFGLGNFDPLFSLQHQIPITTARIIHPESDWLWWWSEAGLLSVLPVGFALTWIVRRGLTNSTTQKHRRHHRLDQRLRSVAMIGLLLAALHGLFDVPLHGIGFAAVTLLLAACAIPRHHLARSLGMMAKLSFRLGGIILLGLGGAHLLSARSTPVLSDRTALKAHHQNIQNLTATGRHQEAMQTIDRALTLAPLDWSLYFQRGLLRLQLRQAAGAALEDFNRSRVLEPNNTQLRLEEGRLWLVHQPALAIIPWRELMQHTRDAGIYTHILGLARPHPDLTASLRLLATTPALKTVYAIHATTPEQWPSALQDLLALDPGLAQINPELRLQLLSTWQARGDRAALVTALEANAPWREQGWSLLAEEYALRSDFEKAWNLQKTHVFSVAPAAAHTDQNIEQLERNHLFNPTDARQGVELYFAQRRLGRLTEARRTLDRLLTLPNPPDFLQQELASLYAEQRDFRLAYETMKLALAGKVP